MSYVLGGALGVLSFSRKNGKLIFVLVISYALIIFIFNKDNPDLFAYQEHFAGRLNDFSEPIYISGGMLFDALGLNFWIYRAFLAVLGVYLISGTIKKFSPYPAFNLFLYILYPFIIDVVQIRFFTGYAFVIYSIKYIIYYRNTKDKKNVFWFIISIIIGTGFHYSIIMYLVLLLLFFDIKKHKLFFYIVIPLFLIFTISNIDLLAPVVGLILGESKTRSWILREKNATLVNIIRILVTRSTILIIIYFFSLFKKNRGYIAALSQPELLHKRSFFYDIETNAYLFLAVLYIDIFSLLELLVASEYERMSRPALIVGSILACRQLYSMEKRNQIICSFILFAFVLLYFVGEMYFQDTYDQIIYFEWVFRRVMENNLLFR